MDQVVDWVFRWMNNGWMDWWLVGWVHGMDGWVGAQMDGWMNECVH